MKHRPAGGARYIPAGKGRLLWVVGDIYTFKVVGQEYEWSFCLLEGRRSAASQAAFPAGEAERCCVLEKEPECLDGDRALTIGRRVVAVNERGKP